MHTHIGTRPETRYGLATVGSWEGWLKLKLGVLHFLFWVLRLLFTQSHGGMGFLY